MKTIVVSFVFLFAINEIMAQRPRSFYPPEYGGYLPMLTTYRPRSFYPPEYGGYPPNYSNVFVAQSYMPYIPFLRPYAVGPFHIVYWNPYANSYIYFRYR